MYHFQIQEYRKGKKGEVSMGYWVGMTTKSGCEANFYVEDDNGTKRYYNGKDKRHEYRNEEPYDLIKDHTKLVKKIEKAIKPFDVKENKPEIDLEVKTANAERFKELTTPAGLKAKELLAGDGLNHASFIRALGQEVKQSTRKSTKAQYNTILNELTENDLIRKEGLNYLYK